MAQFSPQCKEFWEFSRNVSHAQSNVYAQSVVNLNSSKLKKKNVFSQFHIKKLKI